MTQRNTGDRAPTPDAKATTIREAKGSVHEAIGKLIGDDAAEAQGSAEKQAAAKDAKSHPRPRD